VILLVGNATDVPDVKQWERELMVVGKGATKKLILLHSAERHVQPGVTSRWLKVDLPGTAFVSQTDTPSNDHG
jgi:hypothetical protein